MSFFLPKAKFGSYERRVIFIIIFIMSLKLALTTIKEENSSIH